ncbi:MAG: hypothetical protein E7523_08435 [Ruminococcaceae bacterium]|nr:hypothetical protein [Oscillospiraceae bacterium]
MNKNLLEYEMKKRKVSIGEMCSMLGLSRSAFYRKCNGGSEFTLKEVKMIISYLKLDNQTAIFFEEEVS